MNGCDQRRAYTIIEAVISLAILSIVLVLITAAVQKTRVLAQHAENKNRLRQICLGFHSLANQEQDRIAGLTTPNQPAAQGLFAGAAPFYRILPFIGYSYGSNDPVAIANLSPEEQLQDSYPNIPLYINSLDSTLVGAEKIRSKSCYAYNMLLFDRMFNFSTSAKDGHGQTIAISDKYFAKISNNPRPGGIVTMHIFTHMHNPESTSITYGKRRPTFADSGWSDVMPVTDPTTHLTTPSVAGKTFQIRNC
jgi:type II secretory pathway pseudopilin PulG